MKNNKWLWYLLPIAIGGFIIYKKLKGGGRGQDAPDSYDPKDDSKVETKKEGNKTTSKPSVAKFFPMKRGSRGAKVKELQQAIMNYASSWLPKYKDDGDFGAETENAVFQLLNKKTIDSQEDINTILNLKKTQETKNQIEKANTDREVLAKKLIALYNKDPYSNEVHIINKVQLKTADITTDGRLFNEKIVVYNEGRLPIGSNANLSVPEYGFIVIKNNNKYWRVSPYAIQIK